MGKSAEKRRVTSGSRKQNVARTAVRGELAAPGVVNLSQLQAMEIMYEHTHYAGLAGIPTVATAA